MVEKETGTHGSSTHDMEKYNTGHQPPVPMLHQKILEINGNNQR